MIYRNALRGTLTLSILLLVSACAGAADTPAVPLPAETGLPAPVQPAAVQALPTEVPATEAPSTSAAVTPAAAGTDAQTTPDGTASPTVTPTRASPLDLPFLMRIDRVSVVVGRGTLLEGRVANGTLEAAGSVAILGPQSESLSPGLLAITVASVVREQVTVGDYAGLLVEGLDATRVQPGMLVVEAGAYDSYEQALLDLQQ